MRNILIYVLSILLLVNFFSCKKDDSKTNYFSFQGKDYQINEAKQYALIFNEGTYYKTTLFVLFFSNYSGADTTTLMLTVFFLDSNILDGNYPSINQEELEHTWLGIVPYLGISVSAILFDNGTYYLSGKGGSMDASAYGFEFDIKFKNISFGNYNDLLDSNNDKNCEFSKVGEIVGNYNGKLKKETEILNLENKDELNPNKIIEKMKKFNGL